MIVDKDLANRIDLTDLEVVTYLLVQYITMANHFEEQLLTPEIFFFYIMEVPESVHKDYMAAISSLIDKGVIKGRKLSKGQYMIYRTTFDHKYMTFVNVEYGDIETIIKNGDRLKYKLVRYWLVLMGTTYKNTGIGKMPMYYLAEQAKCDERTIIRYNKLLEDIKVLYVRRDSSLQKGDDGQNYKQTNIYGAYTNKEAIDEYADQVLGVNPADKNRSMMAKYVWFNRGRQYEYDEVMAIYNYIQQYNEQEENYAHNNVGYIPEYKDVKELENFLGIIDIN